MTRSEHIRLLTRELEALRAEDRRREELLTGLLRKQSEQQNREQKILIERLDGLTGQLLDLRKDLESLNRSMTGLPDLERRLNGLAGSFRKL